MKLKVYCIYEMFYKTSHLSKTYLFFMRFEQLRYFFGKKINSIDEFLL